MDYSANLKALAKEHKVPVQTLVMADLISIGYDEEDAYFIAFGLSNSLMSDTQNDSIRQNIVNANNFGSLVLKRKKSNSSQRAITDESFGGDLFSKERVAQEMLRSAMKLDINNPDRVAALMKYADLMGMKKEETRMDEEPTTYYLPLKCGICPFKDYFHKKEKESE